VCYPVQVSKLKPNIIFFLFLFISINCPAQIITSIAGNGQYGFSPDGTAALNASLNGLSSIKFGPPGDVYLIDGNRIRKIDTATHILSTVAGNGVFGFSGDGGPALNASLNYLSDFCIDKAGNIFICDPRNNRVRKVDAVTGIITTIAGNGTTNYTNGQLALSTGLNKPLLIDVDNNGNLYIGISDLANYGGFNYIYKLDAATGIITAIAGNGTNVYSGSGTPALQTGFYIQGMRADAAGNIYFADPVHNAVLKLTTSTGIITTVAGTGTISGYGYTGDGGLATQALLNGPVDISFDVNGDLLIVDEGSNVIRKITMATGIISTVSGDVGADGYSGDGGPATCADQHIYSGHIQPSGITTDKAGNFYFVDQSNQYIRRVDNSIVVPVNPTLSISTVSSNICNGQTAIITSTLSNTGNDSIQPIYQWMVNGNVTGGGRAIFISNTLKNNDTVYCVVQTNNNVCKPVTIMSNKIIFTIISSIVPTVKLSASDTAVCPGMPVTFSVSLTNVGDSVSYQWQLNGNNIITAGISTYTDNSIATGDKINCMVTANSISCPVIVTSYSDTIQPTLKQLPLVTLLPSDTTVNAGASVQLQALVTGNLSSFNWNPATGLNNSTILNPLASPLKTITYYFTATSMDGCSVNKNLSISVFLPLYIPNAFTPNGDGINDVFRIPPGSSFELKEFSIYDRWGGKIFTTRDIAEGWDGTFNGKSEPAGIYVYTIDGYILGKPSYFKGTVTLIR
jgi:gliding motility-associated-like protein